MSIAEATPRWSNESPAASPHEASFISPLARPRMQGVWIVVAAYNEAQRIGAVLEELLDRFGNIVVVDDGSRDSTAEHVLHYPVWLLHHACNLGQGASLQTGIRFALDQGAEYIATFDADGQHSASDLPQMLKALTETRADFALGSRFMGQAEGMPTLRRVILQLAILFTRLFSGVSLSDAHNGIRVMTRRGAEHLRITMNRMEHASQLIDQIAASGLKYIEVPVHIRYSAESLRKGQPSSAALRIGLKLLVERAIR